MTHSYPFLSFFVVVGPASLSCVLCLVRFVSFHFVHVLDMTFAIRHPPPLWRKKQHKGILGKMYE